MNKKRDAPELRRILIKLAARFLDRRGWDAHWAAAEDVADFVELAMKYERTAIADEIEDLADCYELAGKLEMDPYAATVLRAYVMRLREGPVHIKCTPDIKHTAP